MTDKPRIQVSSNGQYRLDAWANAVSGMGMPALDKTRSSRFDFYGSKIDWRTLSLMYRYDWLSRKVCDRPARDATRRWIKIKDESKSAQLTELERLGVKRSARQAIAWSRLYGGAALLLIVDDGLTPADPLSPARVRRIIEVRPIDRHHIQAMNLISDPYAIQFGEPEFYATNNGTLFHHSRVLRFDGADLTQDEAETEDQWGGSYVELYAEAVKSFQGSMQDVRHIMAEQGIGMLKMPGLTNSVAMGGKIFDVIQKRLDQFNLSKSLYRTAAMDAEEDFEFRSRQISGLESLLDRFMTNVAGATEMPELVLFGRTPGGLNASQEEQLAVYYDMVRGIQEDDLTAALNTVLACMNKGDIPEWDYVPLQEPSEAAQADMRHKEAQAVAVIADIAGLMPDAVVRHLNSTGHFDLPEIGLADRDLEGLL